MSLSLVVDMNLSPEWVKVLEAGGFQASHWQDVGNPRATDDEIMKWAARNGRVVFTHDMDFGAVLAMTGASAPSVFQMRGRNVLPEQAAGSVLETLSRFQTDLVSGALVVLEGERARVRILPF